MESKPLARFLGTQWIYLRTDKTKMSKSLGNFVLIKGLVKRI